MNLFWKFFLIQLLFDDFFEKLHINSIQALSLLTDLEKEFSIEIPDYELQDVKTFDQLAQLITSRI